MERKSIVAVALLLLFLSNLNLAAQNSQSVYFMNIPQRSTLNPAFRPQNRVYVQLPAISGVNVYLKNNFLSYSDIFMQSPTRDSLISVLDQEFDIMGTIANMKKNNSLQILAKVQLFGVGFAVGEKSFLSIDINERISGNINIPGKFFNLFMNDEGNLSNLSADLSSLRGDLLLYHEIGLGYSREIGEHLSIGAKGKLLMGLASGYIKNEGLRVNVDDDYLMTVTSDVSGYLSGPFQFTTDENNVVTGVENKGIDFPSFLLNGDNLGLGLDLGAEYRLLNDRLKLSASVMDFGFIKWKKDVTSAKMRENFTVQGADISEYYESGQSIDSLMSVIIGSVSQLFAADSETKSFVTYLPQSINFAASFNVTKSISAGVLSSTSFFEKQVRESVTFSANANLGNYLSTALAYTMSNSTFDNLGLGLSLRVLNCQVYVVADRIPLKWATIPGGESSVKIPSNWNTLNVQAGLNLCFGNKAKGTKSKGGDTGEKERKVKKEKKGEEVNIEN